MILALDVLYDETLDTAVAAGVVFADWQSAQPTATMTRALRGIEPYQPGHFYRRELPCLLPLVQQARDVHAVGTVVVDGFVDLGARGPGLGRHLHEACHRAFEVVGVAKNHFSGNPGIAVYRGTSKRPLWVTATGDAEQAAERVRAMAGAHRMPALLGLVDRLTRGHNP